MITDPTDGRPGLRIESAASVVLRDTILRHMQIFGHVIQHDRATNKAVLAAYIDGMAGAIALTVGGGFGGSEDIINATVAKLREAVARDLHHLKR